MNNLFFIGLYQPLGAIFPIAERQACIAGDYLLGQYHLPSLQDMERAIASEQEAMQRRYVPSKRHTMQVDFDAFMAQLQRERKAGSARAVAAGHRLPVTPRAKEAAGAPLEAVDAS